MRMVVAVPVSAAAFVIMVMVMAVIVAMFMPVGMIVGMAVCVPMIMQRIHALCQCLVLGKAGVMAVAVAAAIGTGLGLEGRIHQGHLRAQAQQHVVQHGVVFQVQVGGGDLHRDMPVAQAVLRVT